MKRWDMPFRINFVDFHNFINIVPTIHELDFNLIGQVMKIFEFVPTLHQNQWIFIVQVEADLVKFGVIFLNLPVLTKLADVASGKVGVNFGEFLLQNIQC
jgi:hypothetical protein